MTAVREPHHQVLARVTNRLAADLPGLGPDGALTAVTLAESQLRTALRRLDAYLAAHRDAFTSGSPDCPASFIRLAHTLAEMGYPVVLPRCAVCGRSPRYLRSSADGRLCSRCWAVKLSQRTCDRCGQLGRAAARRADGTICYKCYQADPTLHEPCGRCGRAKRPVQRLGDGTPLCDNCYDRPQLTCTSCGRMRPVKAHQDGGPICDLCYRPPARKCGRCGRVRPITKRAGLDGPDLCGGCHQGVMALCSVCGRVRPCIGAKTSSPICNSCYPRRPRECCRCGRVRLVNAEWPIGRVCTMCYQSIRDNPARCAQCGITQPLIGIDPEGRRICGPCSGVDVHYFCRTCGQGGRQYADGQCCSCVLQQRVESLLTSRDGSVHPQLWPLFEALVDVEHPVSILGWLRKSDAATLLGKLVQAGEPISHQMLDQLAPSSHLYYLRNVLMHTGVLEPRNEYLGRMTPWLKQFLAAQPPQHARIIEPFATWDVLRKARRRADTREFTERSGASIRRIIKLAASFLNWLSERNQSLATMTQDDVDQWLDDKSAGRRHEVRFFLAWASSRGLAPKIQVQAPRPSLIGKMLDEEERQECLRRCVSDEYLPLDVRVAGALVALYGFRIIQIARLTHADIQARGGDFYLEIEQSALVLPPRLAQLISQLEQTARPTGAIGRTLGKTPWLLPGRQPGRHVSANFLAHKLALHGIQATATRNAAVLALAEDLPAAVLADLLGMHPTTAERWAKIASRDWAHYITARATDDRAEHLAE
jgi:hypothetical protein